MQAAEEAGKFFYTGEVLPGASDDSAPSAAGDLLANRLVDLDIGKPTLTPTAPQPSVNLPTAPTKPITAAEPPIPQKVSKPASTARPLTTDDDDLDFDIEIDENIDTTVSHTFIFDIP